MGKGTLYNKTIEAHRVKGNQILMGRRVIHEVTSNPEAFERLRDEGYELRFPEFVFATLDHIVETDRQERPLRNKTDEIMAKTLEDNVRDFNVTYFAPGSGDNGVCHVVFPEQGIIWPGMTVICGDSHTSTYGALGAVGFGVGSTQLGYGLGSNTYPLDKELKVRRINLNGKLQRGVTAKDGIMLVTKTLGAKAGNGYAHEFGGPVVEDMGVEGRFTMCNMGIEGGAKVTYVNPDEKTFEYLKGRPYAPKRDWDKAVEYWKSVASDSNAEYDDVVDIDVSGLEPMVTWGTVSDQSIGISEKIPHTDQESLKYMHLLAGSPIKGTPLDIVSILSCTNARLSDMAEAAEILEGREVSVRTLIVPGSERVKSDAERMGYAKVLEDAGAEWRLPGCSLCLSMSPDRVYNQERIGSTSNRNFMDRQGIGAKTHLMSPYMAAASAIEGKIADPREFLK